jgi:hypothetical protein
MSIDAMPSAWLRRKIDVADSHPLGRFARQHIELVPKDEDLSLQCGPRPE